MPDSQSDNVTDISDKSFEELLDADRSVLQELAKERAELDGRSSDEAIVRGLFRLDGREDEIPDEYREADADDESEPDTEADDAESEATTQVADEDDDEGDGEDADESEDEDEDFTTASNYEPGYDESFIIEAGTISGWFDHITPMVDEAKVHLNRGDLGVRAVDPANVGMVDTRIDAVAFDSFDVPEEGIIGLNVNRVSDILGGANDGDLVHIRYDNTTRNLVFEYGGHQFTISLIDPASIRKEPDLPDLDLPVRFEIEAGVFKTAVQNADDVTDHIGIEAYREDGVSYVEIVGEGDTDEYRFEAEDGEDVDFIDHPDERVRSLFSLDYMKDVVKPFTRASTRTLTIDLGDEFPIKVEADVEDNDGTRVGEVVYMLAPRIQSD